MACSAAQHASNARNARKSTGPKTEEGKAQSRRNGLKHGLTGSGIVLPTEDAAEVERRFEALEADMKPRSEVARQLVNRVALMTFRLDRSALSEAKAIAFRMRHATAEFDHARLAVVEKAYSWIAHEPSTNVRLLKTMPEGVDRLIFSLEGMKTDLRHLDGARWTWAHCEHLHHVMGVRPLELPISRARALSEAVLGELKYLESDDAPGLAKLERQAWAADRIAELIDEQVGRLQAHRASLDLATLELDRLEAPERALFDASPAAVLARKYEANSERGFYRALEKFEAAQAEPEASEESTVEVDPADELGSCFPSGPEGKAGDERISPVEAEIVARDEAGTGEGRSLDTQWARDERGGAAKITWGPEPGPLEGQTGRV